MNEVVIALATYYIIRKRRATRSAKKIKRRGKRARINRYHVEGNGEGGSENEFGIVVANRAICYENFHMDEYTFDELFGLLEPHLTARRNCRRDFICTRQKVAAVLEYLASGSLASQVGQMYTISKQHMGSIIDNVCDAICIELKPYISAMSKEELLNISKGYMDRWQFPHCIGSLDAKRVVVKAPPKSTGANGAPSMVLFAVADWKYKFTYLDIGAYGLDDAGKMFSASDFGKAVLHEGIDFPENELLGAEKLPYCFVGADVLPLCKRILKPYLPRNRRPTEEEFAFNCRVGRARRCIENALGILCANWLCLKRTMICRPEKGEKIVTACFLLHNFLMDRSLSYCPPGFADEVDSAGNFVEGEWRDSTEELKTTSLMGSNLGSNRGRQCDVAKRYRDKFKDFFNSPIGAVPWQEEAATNDC